MKTLDASAGDVWRKARNVKPCYIFGSRIQKCMRERVRKTISQHVWYYLSGFFVFPTQSNPRTRFSQKNSGSIPTWPILLSRHSQEKQKMKHIVRIWTSGTHYHRFPVPVTIIVSQGGTTIPTPTDRKQGRQRPETEPNRVQNVIKRPTRLWNGPQHTCGIAPIEWNPRMG